MGNPPKKGTPEYDEWRNKISNSLKGSIPWNKGKATGITPPNKSVPMSEDQKAKVSASRKGIPRSEDAKAQAAESNRGRKRTPEQKSRISESQKGKVVSPETKRRISEAKRGKPSHRKGTTHSEESRKKIVESRAKQVTPKGYKHDEAFRAKASEKNRAYWQNATEDERRNHLDKLHEGARNITNSSIENVYAEQLDAQAVVYERQKRIGWYRVDFYIPAENRIAEVNGCYWHCCEQCGYADAHKGKLEADTKRYDYLRGKGYVVEVIWEHELPRKPWKPKDKGG